MGAYGPGCPPGLGAPTRAAPRQPTNRVYSVRFTFSPSSLLSTASPLRAQHLRLRVPSDRGPSSCCAGSDLAFFKASKCAVLTMRAWTPTLRARPASNCAGKRRLVADVPAGSRSRSLIASVNEWRAQSRHENPGGSAHPRRSCLMPGFSFPFRHIMGFDLRASGARSVMVVAARRRRIPPPRTGDVPA